MDIFSLIPQFGGLIWTILAFVVALSVIVAVHEYGHYIVGRWSGIKADVFSLGFGPVLFSRTDRHGTIWQFAALPFGGYVKFRGDANAASGADTDAVAELTPEERRATMPGAPLWARAATVAAGPIFNFAMSIIVFAAVVMVNGTVKEPLSIGELTALPTEYELQVGDEILAIAGQALPGADAAPQDTPYYEALPREPVLEYRIRRDGEERTVQGPYPQPPVINQLQPRSAAFSVGLEVGDVIQSVDGAPIFAFYQLKDIVESSNGRGLPLEVWRDGEVLEFVLVPRRVDEPQPDNTFVTYWRIGIVGGLFFEPATGPAGLWESVSAGVSQTLRIINGSLSGLQHMITGAISTCNLSGPIGIAQTSGQLASQGGESFIWFIAVLSTAVGLLNLFPIPVLDGGHLVFYGYEAVTGRKPSDRVINVLMTIGLTLILALMVFALSRDLLCP